MSIHSPVGNDSPLTHEALATVPRAPQGRASSGGLTSDRPDRSGWDETARRSLEGLGLPAGCERLRDDIAAAAARVLAKWEAANDDAGARAPRDGDRPSAAAAIVSSLQHDAFLLTWALWPLVSAGMELGEVVLRNVSAGGAGERSLLARELGVGWVVHHNPFESQCDEAIRAGAAVGLSADHYLASGDDVTALLRAGGKRGTGRAWGRGRPWAIVSFDALEHIYNVGGYLRRIIEVLDESGGPLSLALGSGANPCNTVVRRRVMREQLDAEAEPHPGNRQGRASSLPASVFKPSPEASARPRSREAYRLIRRRMITGAAPELRPQQVELLVSRTRGMRSDDILRSIERLRATGEFPSPPRHPTNTCDPITGNGCAQLLNPHVLATVLTAAGVTSRVLAGYYEAPSAGASPLRRWTRRAVNAAIRAGGPFALRYAPSYVIQGTRGL